MWKNCFEDVSQSGVFHYSLERWLSFLGSFQERADCWSTPPFMLYQFRFTYVYVFDRICVVYESSVSVPFYIQIPLLSERIYNAHIVVKIHVKRFILNFLPTDITCNL